MLMDFIKPANKKLALILSVGAIGAGLGAYLAMNQAEAEPAAPAPAATAAPANDFAISFEGLLDGQINMADYAGKVVLVVNTASRCGYTPQLEGLAALYEARKDDGFVIVGVPSNDFGGQEPGTAAEISEFCTLNYGVTFPMAAKTPVTGANAHPFYQWAISQAGEDAIPRWNFHKILIGKNGQIVGTFRSGVRPDAPELSAAINQALAAQ